MFEYYLSLLQRITHALPFAQILEATSLSSISSHDFYIIDTKQRGAGP